MVPFVLRVVWGWCWSWSWSWDDPCVSSTGLAWLLLLHNLTHLCVLCVLVLRVLCVRLHVFNRRVQASWETLALPKRRWPLGPPHLWVLPPAHSVAVLSAHLRVVLVPTHSIPGATHSSFPSLPRARPRLHQLPHPPRSWRASCWMPWSKHSSTQSCSRGLGGCQRSTQAAPAEMIPPRRHLRWSVLELELEPALELVLELELVLVLVSVLGPAQEPCHRRLCLGTTRMTKKAAGPPPKRRTPPSSARQTTPAVSLTPSHACRNGLGIQATPGLASKSAWSSAATPCPSCTLRCFARTACHSSPTLLLRR